MKTGGGHNGTESRHRSESEPETCSTETQHGRHGSCVYVRQNQKFDVGTTKVRVC